MEAIKTEKAAVYSISAKLIDAEIAIELNESLESISGRFVGLDPKEILQLQVAADRLFMNGQEYRILSLQTNGRFRVSLMTH